MQEVLAGPVRHTNGDNVRRELRFILEVSEREIGTLDPSVNAQKGQNPMMTDTLPFCQAVQPSSRHSGVPWSSGVASASGSLHLWTLIPDRPGRWAEEVRPAREENSEASLPQTYGIDRFALRPRHHCADEDEDFLSFDFVQVVVYLINGPNRFVDLIWILWDVIHDDIAFHHVFIELFFGFILQKGWRRKQWNIVGG